jgi:hypothetical protein
LGSKGTAMRPVFSRKGAVAGSATTFQCAILGDVRHERHRVYRSTGLALAAPASG